MRVDTHACDACNTQRKDSNHWFKVIISDDRTWATIVPWDTFNSVCDRPWSPYTYVGTTQYRVYDACGLPHAYQIIDKHLEVV